MTTTSVSLLERLRRPDDQEAWSRFVHLYTPLLHTWARQIGLQEQDANDMIQEVLVSLVRKLPEFAYDPSRSFRGWLRTVLRNKWRDRCQPLAVGSGDGAPRDAELAGPDPTDAIEEAEYRRYLVGRGLQLIQSEFQPMTWQACWEFVALDRPAAEVARDLGISVNAVYHAKSRVLCRLRCELQGLLD